MPPPGLRASQRVPSQQLGRRRSDMRQNRRGCCGPVLVPPAPRETRSVGGPAFRPWPNGRVGWRWLAEEERDG